MQQKCKAKLLGYDYDIVYVGHENGVADALSRKGPGQTSTIPDLSTVQTDWLTALKDSWLNDPELQTLVTALVADPTSHEGYFWQQGLLTYKGQTSCWCYG